MGKFVESAILKVIDQSTRNLNRIEKALKSFRSEAARLKNVNVNINTSKVSKATTEINRLSKAIKTVTSPKIGLANVNSTLAGLRKIQSQVAAINKQTVNIRTRTTGGGAGGGNVSPPRVPGGAGGAGGAGGYRFNVSTLDLWAIGFMSRLGHTIETSITNGFREGTKNVGQSYLRNQALGTTPDQIAEIDKLVADLVRKNPNFTRSDYRTLAAEVGPVANGDIGKTRELLSMITDFANSRLTQTGDAEEALSGVRSIIKALDNINRLQDAGGDISGEAKDYLRVFIEESVLSGQDITPEKINTALVYSRTTGKTLTPDGIRTLIDMLESMGRVAGSSLNRLVENLSGNTTKKALNAQEEFGLIELKQVQTGTDGNGKPVTENTYVPSGSQTLLREDPNAYIIAELIPRLVKKGVDINDAAQVANAVAPLFGSVVAKDVANNIVLAQGEFKTRREAAGRVPSNPEIQEIVNENPLLVFNSIQRQFVELLGEVGTTILDRVVGPMKMFRDGLIDISDFLGGQDRDLQKLGLVGAGAAAVGGAGFLAASKAKSFLLSPVVFATSLDTASTALGRFTLAVNGASAGSATPDIPSAGGRKGRGIGKIATAAAALAGATVIYTIAEEGKNEILTNPELKQKDDEATDRNMKNIQAIKDFFTQRPAQGSSDAFGALPGTGDASQQNYDIGKFLLGEGTGLKDALAIEINSGVDAGIENTGNSLLQTFTDGAALISSGGTELGNVAGGAMMAIAGPFGAAIAAALQANFNPGTLQVQVSATAPSNTGANTNNAR